MSDNNLICIFIAKKKKALAYYTNCKGFFNQICEKILSKLKEKSLSKMKYNEQMIYYLDENEKTYIILTDPSYHQNTAISCLESLNKEFGDILDDTDIDNIEEYGLSRQFEEKLKMKYDFYNTNSEIVSENIQNLKIEMMDFKDEVYKVNEEIDERGQKIEVIENKAEKLADDSSNYFNGAKKVKKKESKRKWWYSIAIIIIILIIVYFVMRIICGNWTFQCGSQS
jgi:vesicle-associated membrane protein 7